MCLNLYELLPFWHTFLTKLGFAVHTSPMSSRGLYLAGQATIPSDTACFPAKLSHGHIKALSQMKLDAIFYPCLTYNWTRAWARTTTTARWWPITPRFSRATARSWKAPLHL